ncbi:MAG: winged helix-turn-helix domain-containing protein [Methylobacter sp.]
MNTDFLIVLVSNNPYQLGLLKGYCHAHRYNLLETEADMDSLNAIIQLQPNIIIFAADHVQDPQKKVNFEMMREISVNHKIPVCYLRDINHISGLEENLCWMDTVLDAPLDVTQLDHYLHDRFKHHRRFMQEKRSRVRRASHDRRLAMFDTQSAGVGNKSANNPIQGGCFVLDPFQIDQRSKSVLFNGKSLNLTRKEFELFELLAQDADRVFMADEIISHLWPENSRATKSDLYQYMHLLRKKIELDPNNPRWILTVKGFGYKLNVSTANKINSLNMVPITHTISQVPLQA